MLDKKQAQAAGDVILQGARWYKPKPKTDNEHQKILAQAKVLASKTKSARVVYALFCASGVLLGYLLLTQIIKFYDRRIILMVYPSFFFLFAIWISYRHFLIQSIVRRLYKEQRKLNAET